jgi:hypothetical protein
LRWPAAAVLLLVLLAALAAGCGGLRDEEARAPAERFLRALAAGDGAAACAELGDDARDALEREDGGAACARGVLDLDAGRGPITRVQVQVLAAKVDLADGTSAFLGEGREGWRIDAVGCRPSAKPADVPFDCALDG